MFKYFVAIIAALLAITFTAQAAPFSWDFTGGVVRLIAPQNNAEVRIPYLTATSTATSTLPTLNVTTLSFGGVAGTAWSTFCTSITGSASLCDGSDDGGGGGGGSISTSTTPVAGQLAFWTSANALSSVATGTLTESVSGLELNATRALVGGAAALGLTTGYEIPLTASTTNWQTAFSWGNHSVAGYLTSIATTTVRGMLSATSPLSYNSGTGDFSLSTAGDWTGTFDGQQGTWYIDRGNHSGTQLASTISDFNSTARGLLSETITGITYTSGTGVFSLDASYTIPTSTLINNLNSFYTLPSTVITAGDALTWSSNTLNFDGGNTPAGDLGGTWASPSVTDDSHAHTGTTISGLDISSDTNLTAGDALTLTDDDIDFDGGAAPGGELGGTWVSPTLDDSIAVTGWNLTTPTLTSFFGTPCTGNEFLQDISDTGAFTCAAASGGGGGGALSTTTDIIGNGGSQLVSYVTGDVMFGGSASTSAEFQFDDDGGQFIISSSSANATATIESTNSADAVRLGESTGGGGGVEFSFFNGSSTTLSPYGTQIGDLFQFLNFTKIIISSLTDVIQNFSTVGRDWSIGILADAHKNFSFYVGSTFTGNPAFVISASSTIAVGTSTYHGGPLLDGAYIPGIVNTGEWIEEFCTTPVGETVQIAADTARGCGRYYYAEDAAGVIDFTTQSSGTAPYFRLRAGTAGTAVAAGDGMGINWGIGLDGGDLQLFSPVMEWVWRRGLQQNASSTFVVGGITNAVGVSADFAAEPSEGFYVIATTTTPNFVFACNPSSGGTTYSSTGIASSTVGSGDESAFRQWRIEITGTVNTSQTATLYSRTATTSMQRVGTPCTINQSASTAILAPTVGLGKATSGTSPELHVQWIKFWYKSPL